MSHIIHTFKKIIANKLLPHQCVLCTNPSNRFQDLCEHCHNTLPILTHSCPKCAKPLLETEKACASCKISPPPFDDIFVPFFYRHPVTHLILTLKFNEAFVYGKILGELFSDKIQEKYTKEILPDLIMPVPLHPKRLQERGFNQAQEIARPIAKRFHLPIDTTSCVRVKSTAAQATLTSLERKTNLQSAFSVRKNLLDKKIAILDDVMTTGHTLTELARTLKKAGAKKVIAWCFARAIL